MGCCDCECHRAWKISCIANSSGVLSARKSVVLLTLKDFCIIERQTIIIVILNVASLRLGKHCNIIVELYRLSSCVMVRDGTNFLFHIHIMNFLDLQIVLVRQIGSVVFIFRSTCTIYMWPTIFFITILQICIGITFELEV